MYVALNSMLTVGGKLTWPEFARLAAKTGYGGAEVMLEPAMQDGAEATRRLLGELNIKPAVVNLPVEFRKDDAAFQAGLKKLPEISAFSAAIGCPRMVTWMLPSSNLPKDEQRKIYLDRLSACASILARDKVRLGLENVSPVHLRKLNKYEFIYRMDEMLQLAKDCGPNCGMLLDSWHWHHSGATPADIVAAGKDRIVHVHLADAPKIPPEDIRDNERLFPGEGVLDWKGFFGALQKIGYADAVAPEVFGHGIKEMGAQEGAWQGLKFTREAMRNAGLAAVLNYRLA